MINNVSTDLFYHLYTNIFNWIYFYTFYKHYAIGYFRTYKLNTL